MKVSKLLCTLVLLSSCQNRMVESKSNVALEKNELMRRIEVAKVQVEANTQITDIFEQVRLAIRQFSSLMSMGSSSYTPFDTLKQMFDDVGSGIPSVEGKNKYIYTKTIKAPSYIEGCEEFEVYTKLEDKAPDVEKLEIEGQKLIYALKGCQFVEEEDLVEISWTEEGLNFSINSQTYNKLVNKVAYIELVQNLIEEKLPGHLAKNITCETEGKIFDRFKFACENIEIDVYSSGEYVHFILIEKFSYDSENYLRFELSGKNYQTSTMWVGDDTQGQYQNEIILKEEDIFIKIYEDGGSEIQLTPVLDSLKENPEVLEKKDEILNEVTTEIDSNNLEESNGEE